MEAEWQSLAHSKREAAESSRSGWKVKQQQAVDESAASAAAAAAESARR